MPTEFVRVASVSDLPGNGMLAANADGEEILVARIGDDYYALDGWCSHEAGLLGEGNLHEGTCEVECPIHEGFFNLKNGRATAPPADEAVTAYEVRIEGDDILVGPKS
ncbi:MAG: non-heme iron oxygenase ferredoxin subunit [Chloroflexi bacterium]|nr:non-heme iron oxygenase ferredoxin subunit [Chloroflexota bacterium]MDA1174082.1 non-heme iron oxygenase ferredoxin subunit [Chloroflexota bacterium]